MEMGQTRAGLTSVEQVDMNVNSVVMTVWSMFNPGSFPSQKKHLQNSPVILQPESKRKDTLVLGHEGLYC